MMSGMTAVAIGIIATIIAMFLAGLTFGHHRRQSLRFWHLEQRLPDAVRFEDLQARVAAFEAEHEALRERLYDAHETLDEAARKLGWMETVREEIASLEQQRQEVERIQNELETKQISLAELQEQLLKEESACKEIQKEIEMLIAEEKHLKKQLQELQSEEEKLESIKKELTELAKQKASAKEEVETIKKKADQLREDLEWKLRRQKEAQETELAELKRVADRDLAKLDQNAKLKKEELESRISALKRECDQAAREQEVKQKELDDFEKRLADLRNQRKDLNAERKELNKEVEGLEGRKSALKGQIPTLESAFSKLSSSLDRSSTAPDLTKSELWNPVLTVGSERNKPIAELEALEKVSTALEHRGLRFDKRTLHAFHTALKSTGSSPLVTLAGVSGTGKSELPRSYAESMGLNFLGIAVQPRWDSPHDLFGFYDYLEQRFRPTELTRALLQLDPIGPKEGRGWGCPDEYADALLEGQMLLVLLDEMNLARVEYYFSEFLSKLETRRGIDQNDAVQRRQAEIVLDVSSRTAAQHPLRLFVGANVLFVGTMNEDESTQALSDKVIDRSNVLRFGSPREVSPLGSKNGVPRSSDRLLHENWKSWCKTMHDLKDTDKDRLLKWVQRIREALDRVGRPFAYRVTNAILEYAANYPDVENRIEYALADQIEQRVLPKLIGLDMQQSNSTTKAISEITSVLDEIGDEKLKEHLNNKNKGEDYFQWTGLDRTVV